MTVLSDTPAVTQVGPYQLTADGDTGWYVLYIEDNEDLESWDLLLDSVPGLGHATLRSEVVVELDGAVRVVAEHWSQPSVLERLNLDNNE